MSSRRGYPRHFIRGCASVATACAALTALALATNVAAAPDAKPSGANGLKTKPINEARVAPFVDAFFDYDAAVKARGGKAPADAGKQLERLKSLAPQAKGEINSFVKRLRAAGETEAYDAMASEHAQQTGSEELMSELRAGGGAAAILGQADRLIDEQIAERGRAAGMDSVSSILDFLLGVPEAHARSSHLCGAFYWLISGANGTNLAYRACYY